MEAVTVDVSGSVATIMVGTGQRFNAMGAAEWRSLGEAARSLAAKPLRAVVVRGCGGTFSSGSNLREWEHSPAEDVQEIFATIEAALQAVEDLPMPTVALVEGAATGAGCQLALACDLQLMLDSARIGMPIARLGILVPPSFANRMSLRIGPSRTKDLLYRGTLLQAAEAHAMGLVSSRVPDDGAETALRELLETWEGLSLASLRAAKEAVDTGLRPLSQPARDLPVGPAADPEEFPWRVGAFLHRKSA
ncbi:enoyl-CoA hydratase/isomerase family protein [Paenarthrobacter sp. DKR-5]|uniref:enoyl-CoA hydratase/isomerase family protein n=1 Tax=Paenarthrobacter sp. DKR-5 TaxID=2835535 RepID=UPI001BDCFCE9|nr:enoyl-CoA hydratase/isomerase family protein [Paenarthrobacter sp. DKR-5]MBT1002966.1 enoyl-CoA hydratase/isomerase family protein [Paenarthrobacter sp. DKR-5]